MCKTRQARPAKFFALLEAAPAFAGPADDAEQGLSTYAAIDKKAIVVPAEAETVRAIFTRYLELGSVRALAEDLEGRGISMPQSWRLDATGQSLQPNPKETHHGSQWQAESQFLWRE
jgi:hypothetical protein